MISASGIQLAAARLRPGGVDYAEDSYESIVWRCDDPPPREEVEEVAALIEVELAYDEIRTKRDRLLAASDWTQAADAPVDSAAWAKYRQALRDLPAKIKCPTAEVAWPESPK
jgi:hypothetical protein